MTNEKLHFEFSPEKNQFLIQERDIGFEDVIAALDNGKLITIIEHYNQTKYPGQKIYIIEIKEYVYLVPYVKKNENTIFLKTIFPSRKLTKKYLDVRGEL